MDDSGEVSVEGPQQYVRSGTSECCSHLAAFTCDQVLSSARSV